MQTGAAYRRAPCSLHAGAAFPPRETGESQHCCGMPEQERVCSPAWYKELPVGPSVQTSCTLGVLVTAHLQRSQQPLLGRPVGGQQRQDRQPRGARGGNAPGQQCARRARAVVRHVGCGRSS